MKPRIRHVVAFTLKHAKGSPEALRFIQDSRDILGAIPHVAAFDQCEQVSAKNEYDYVFVFDFDKEADYKAYNEYPTHVKYVKELWETQVVKFQETDLKEL